MQEAFDTSEILIEDWKTIPPNERVGLLHKMAQVQRTIVAIWVAAGCISIIGLGAVCVLVAGFLLERDAPQWATSAIAAIITAAVAMIFGNQAKK